MKVMNRLKCLVIQGGMGFNISTWYLAKIVALLHGLGTASGVALERVLAEALLMGDPGGHFRRALAHFPFPRIPKMVIDAYYIEEGNPRGLTPRGIPVFRLVPSPMFIALSVCANYAAVWLAKEGHDNPISINYLEKIPPHIYAITGAMLAHVDYITMGAGIPLQIPPMLAAIAEGREAKYKVWVEKSAEPYEMSFSPEKFFGEKMPPMRKPGFLPIVSSDGLVTILLGAIAKGRIPSDSFDGFVFEGPTAGGHNAPPRGKPVVLNARGEPVYGPKDEVDWTTVRDTGYPFWIGGSYASPEKLAEARALGAVGVQAGTAFAFCDESGLDPELRITGRRLAFEGRLPVFTSRLISPAGFPFKVGQVPGTPSESATYVESERACVHGCLVTPYENADGTIVYRCPAEPIDDYIRKGGKLEDTVGRCCLCSRLMAAAGLGGKDEDKVLTVGDDVTRLMRVLMRSSGDSYNASDVMKYLLGPVQT